MLNRAGNDRPRVRSLALLAAEAFRKEFAAQPRFAYAPGRVDPLGSRITDAGFGGATVNLLRPGESPRFMARMERDFYDGKPRSIPEPIFSVTASRGAGLIEL